jgi:hypothetical protein
MHLKISHAQKRLLPSGMRSQRIYCNACCSQTSPPSSVLQHVLCTICLHFLQNYLLISGSRFCARVSPAGAGMAYHQPLLESGTAAPDCAIWFLQAGYAPATEFTLRWLTAHPEVTQQCPAILLHLVLHPDQRCQHLL